MTLRTKKAAERSTALRASQARVLNMFVLYGDMHDKQLQAYLHDAEKNAGLAPMSSSGIRTRRSELTKPNMDRLDAITRSGIWTGMDRAPRGFLDLPPHHQETARAMLRREGFKSKLWDTGKREHPEGSRTALIIWGLAR